jgi:hypothetical protein
MANYINTLENQLRNCQLQREAQAERFLQLREHLSLPKYSEPATDGSRVDWIGLADVLRWLRYLEHGDHT